MDILNYDTLRRQNYEGYLLENAPEKVLQFGEGGFMRAFVDCFVDIMNEKAGFGGKVAVVQPRGGHADTTALFSEQQGLYTLILRGREKGEKVCRKRIVSCISRCIDPKENWQQVLDAGCGESIKFIISNTTEAGIAYDPACRREDNPPASYPAKLLAVLLARFEAGMGGVWILPCELNDHNGDLLTSVLHKYMDDWQVSPEFRRWFEEENKVCSTLVDRIVTGFPKGEAEELYREFGYIDRLTDTAEPFGFWVIEAPESIKKDLPFEKAGLPVLVTDNHTPYKQRKVRILNGAHTSMVMGAYLAGKNIVRECMQDPAISGFLDKALYSEIIPTLDLPAEELNGFAADVKERFSNPYIDHSLLAISLNSAAKWRERVMPSVTEYFRRFGKLPDCLTAGFAFWVAFCHNAKEKGEGCLIGYRVGDRYEVKDDPYVLDFFFERREKSPEELMYDLVRDAKLWGGELEKIPGFEAKAAGFLKKTEKNGAYALMKELTE